MQGNHLRTLVLGADYQPIGLFPHPLTIPADDAFTRVLNGSCEVVCEYDRYIKTQNPNFKQKWPSVIARKEYEVIHHRVGPEPTALFYRDHGKCAYCGTELTLQEKKPNSLTIDHVIPQSKGGPHTWNNIVASCSTCNHAKSNHQPIGQWKPKWDPWVPTYWQLVQIRKKFPIILQHESWVPFLGDWHGDIKIAA